MLCNKCGDRLRNKKCPRCGWEPFQRKRPTSKKVKRYWRGVYEKKVPAKR